MEHEFSKKECYKRIVCCDLPFLLRCDFFPDRYPRGQGTNRGRDSAGSDTSGTSPPLRIERNRLIRDRSQVAVTTFETWQSLANRLNEKLIPREDAVRSLYRRRKI